MECAGLSSGRVATVYLISVSPWRTSAKKGFPDGELYFHMPRSRGDTDANSDSERFEELMVADESEFCNLLECVLGLNGSDADVYRYVLAHPHSTVKELSQAMDCDPSTINRRLDGLRKKELVTRHRNVLSEGGVVYRYQPTSLDRVEKRMHQTLDEWTASMHERIKTVLYELEPPA